MAGKLDLNVDRGTTFRFSVKWSVETDGVLTPFDLTGAVADLVITGDYYSTWTYPVTIEPDDTMRIVLSDKETRDLPVRSEYVVRVTFPSGDVYHALEGHLIGSHTYRAGYYHDVI